jgi:2-iminobutanoate/2-iminopropanoate deaminase
LIAIKKFIRTDKAPLPGGAYSQGIFLNGLLFTAGVGPTDPVSGQLVGATIEEQTHQVMKNLGAILQSAGFDYSDVVKATVHLHDLERDFDGFNQTYQQYFNSNLPVRTTVGSTLKNILVEIDFIAGQG